MPARVLFFQPEQIRRKSKILLFFEMLISDTEVNSTGVLFCVYAYVGVYKINVPLKYMW